VRITAAEVVEALRNGEPSIIVSGSRDALNIAVVMLEPEHVDIVGRRVREVLEQAAVLA
jgi:hypothetical protein